MDAPAPTVEGAAPPGRRPRWQRVVGSVCLVVGLVLVPVALVSVWMRNVVLDTDTYVETVDPLARDPAVVDFVADRLTTRLFAAVDISSVIAEVLPPRATFLADPLEAALRSATREAAVRAMDTDAFRAIWDAANRTVHDQLVAVLTGGGDTVSTSQGTITVDLTSLATQVLAALDARGITAFDAVPIAQYAPTVTVADVPSLGLAQTGTRLLDRTANWLPWLIVVLLGVGLWLSSDRRRSAVLVGVGIALGAVFVLVAVNVGRELYMTYAVGADLPEATAGTVFDTLLRFLVGGGRAIATIGIVAVVIAWAWGPARPAVWVRRQGSRALGGASSRAAATDVPLGAAGEWIADHALVMRLAVIGAGVALLALWTRPSGKVVVFLTFLVLVGLVVVELVVRVVRARRQPSVAPAHQQADGPSS